MRNVKLGYKMALVVAVLVLAILGTAWSGINGLRLVNARVQHVAEVALRDSRICGEIRNQIMQSVRAAKNAVLSPRDEDSLRSAQAALMHATEAEKLRLELMKRRDHDSSMTLRFELEAFNRAWLEWQKHNDQMLKLAVQNSNLHAEVIVRGKARELLEQLSGVLEALSRPIDGAPAGPPAPGGSAEAKLSRIAASLRLDLTQYHLLLAYYIPADAQEMDRLDTQLDRQSRVIETGFSELSRLVTERDRVALDRLLADRAEYNRQAAEIRRLSRLDTNNESARLTTGIGAQLMDDCSKHINALTQAFEAELQSDVNECYDQGSTAIWRMIGLTAIGIIGSVLFAFWIVRSITTHVRSSLELTQALSSGDLTKRLPHAGDDEIGQFSQAMNQMADCLGKIMSDLQAKSELLHGSADELENISHSLASRSEQVSSQSSSVAGATEELSQTIHSMAAAAEQMSMNVSSISSASEEMSVNVHTISSAAEQTSSNVRAVAAAIGDMSGSFDQIAKEVHDGAVIFSKAKENANTATAKMNILHRGAEEINKVTETIKMIALQTNLLALNATIEATSAGEAGKGFAVVASEIKELANQSGKAAEGIAQRIENIQTSIRDAVQVIQAVSGVMGEIDSSAGRVSTAVEKNSQAAHIIVHNVQEASKGVGEIARSIAEVASAASDMTRNVSEAAVGAGAVSRNASEAAQAANAISANIQGVSKATRETSASAAKLRESAKTLATIRSDLREIVGMFKTDRDHG